MKTVFLSLPMKNRSDKDIAYTIRSMKRVIKAMYPEDDIQFVDNFSSSHSFTNEEEDEAKIKSLLYLGDAIQKMSHCDYIAFITSEVFYRFEPYNGCYIEREVASRYGIKYIPLDDPTGEIYLPDLKEKLEEYDKKYGVDECCGRCK